MNDNEPRLTCDQCGARDGENVQYARRLLCITCLLLHVAKREQGYENLISTSNEQHEHEIDYLRNMHEATIKSKDRMLVDYEEMCQWYRNALEDCKRQLQLHGITDVLGIEPKKKLLPN